MALPHDRGTARQQPPGRARLIYEQLLAGAGVGELITYEQVADLLELDPQTNRTVICQACRQAGKWLLEASQRAIDAVPGVGYRVVEAREHITLYKRHQRKSLRSLRRGQAALEHVHREELDEYEQRIVDAGISSTALQLDMYRRFKRDQGRLERGLAVATERGDRTDEQVRQLKDRIARLERNLPADEVEGG